MFLTITQLYMKDEDVSKYSLKENTINTDFIIKIERNELVEHMVGGNNKEGYKGYFTKNMREGKEALTANKKLDEHKFTNVYMSTGEVIIIVDDIDNVLKKIGDKKSKELLLG